MYGETGNAFFRYGGNFSAMGLDDGTNDCQTEPHPLAPGAARGVASVKTVE